MGFLFRLFPEPVLEFEPFETGKPSRIPTRPQGFTCWTLHNLKGSRPEPNPFQFEGALIYIYIYFIWKVEIKERLKGLKGLFIEFYRYILKIILQALSVKAHVINGHRLGLNTYRKTSGRCCADGSQLEQTVLLQTRS